MDERRGRRSARESSQRLSVEFNALWYNALKFAAALFAEDKELASKVEQWNAIADKAGVSFVNTFLNDYGYLIDYVDGSMSDWSVRPNMLIALALDYSPLDKRQRKRALEVVTRELLTPQGNPHPQPQELWV